MGKKDGVVTVTVIKIEVDKDIVVVVDDVVVVGTEIISDNVMVKLMYINKNNKTTIWG